MATLTFQFRPHLMRVWHERTKRHWWQVEWVVRFEGGPWVYVSRYAVPRYMRYSHGALLARQLADRLDGLTPQRQKMRKKATS